MQQKSSNDYDNGDSQQSRNQAPSQTQSMPGSHSLNGSQIMQKQRVGSSVAQSSGGVMDSFSGVNVDEALPDIIHAGNTSPSP